MFGISERLINENASFDTNYKGKLYFRQGRVNDVKFDRENMRFFAKVSGSMDYDVDAGFDNHGNFKDADCNCPAFSKYPGFCKHIVAMLLFIEDRDRKGFFRELNLRKSAKFIFDIFQVRQESIKTPVQLEYTYEYRSVSGYGRGSFSGLELRIGQDKMYVVKSIKKLLEAVEDNEPIEFGKKFIFDPSIHEFKPEDRPVIELLKEIYETDKIVYSLTFDNKASVFKEKMAWLTSSAVGRFFKAIKDRSFNAIIDDKLIEGIKINQGDFPVDFNLNMENNDLILDIDFDGPLISLTEDGEYFFNGGRIYRISDQQRNNFKPFYLAMAYQKDRKLRFVEEDKERFVSEILPFAEKAGRLKMNELVEAVIEKNSLESEIYLDRSGESITADVKLIYGDRVINPFAPLDRSVYASEKIFVRDVDKERLILDLLGQYEFKVKDNKIYLTGDDNIFDFVFNVIPKLQENSTIFYSDKFKNMAVRNPFTFSSRIRLNQESDMLEFGFNAEGIDRKEISSILNSIRHRKKYHKLKNGSFLTLDSKELNEISDFMEYLELDKDDFQNGFVKIPKFRALYLDQLIRDSGLNFIERNHAFKEFVQNIREPADMDFEIPLELKGTLREYQKFGFKWLKTLANYGLGGILADDMGLGKTLQVLVHILADKLENGIHPSIIIVPTSLVYNWCAEVEKFTPELKILAISGSKDERLNLMENIKTADIVVTSYPLIRRDIDEYKEYRFRYCILDEAQHIKNPGSISAKSVKMIKAEKRFALTGTPMENSLSELWSIFDFVLPGYLFSHARFVQKYEGPITKGEGKKQLEELGKHIRPFILRRLKKDVLRELPPKIEHKMTAELTQEQKKVYLAYLQQIKGEIDKEIEEKGFERSQIKILAGLTRLRQICCHPSMFLENFEGESGKMQLLQELIQDAVEGSHRILLFSQFTSMLHIIQNWLKEEKIDFMYLDGSTPTAERGALVKAFNEGQGSVFLISLKAGGTGLNLTGADTVIHFDPWWNPAVEEQATDRAYRIGQEKSVHVMKLITKGTIEEKIFNLQERKKELINSVIQPGETLLTKMTQEEIRGLFE